MFTCFRGGVGHTLLGFHPWKTLSGCIQLDRNKFICFLHSTDWSSTYIKDLNRVDFFSLGVSQQIYLFTLCVFSPTCIKDLKSVWFESLPSRPTVRCIGSGQEKKYQQKRNVLYDRQQNHQAPTPLFWALRLLFKFFKFFVCLETRRQFGCKPEFQFR